MNRYTVELFDGKEIRRFYADEEQLSELDSRLGQLDGALGVTILDTIPEDDGWSSDTPDDEEVMLFDEEYDRFSYEAVLV
ncbi:MAG: hypothetical protein HQL50_14045 [Magnetococcales bacterium]|nr:hypothetical protein [Magnetococcales bacterium]